MSQRIGQERVVLWIVGCLHARGGWKPFLGTLHEVVAHISRLHRESGDQYCARELT